MFISIEKRRENIAEYILYIWQLEDTLRALKFDQNMIYTTLVSGQTNIRNKEKADLLQWYMEFAELLRSEDKLEYGHLQHSLHLIDDLYNLHLQLLTLPIGERYKTLFEKTKPDIDVLRQRMEVKDMSDIDICFRALYSVILLRIKSGNAENKYITDVLEVISPLIALLSDYFKKIEDGEIDLFATPI